MAQPGLLRQALGFESLDLVGIAQGQTNVIKAIEQAELAEGLHIKSQLRAIGLDHDLAFQINGELFDLGAGAAQIALVADYRKNTYSYAPDSDTTAQSGWAPGGNIEAFVVQLPVSKKSISVKEIAGQIDVPLIADKPFAQELAIGIAGRISDYSTSGSVKSYEADARWRPIQNLLFRGSYQRAVRAPNIGELFSPRTTMPEPIVRAVLPSRLNARLLLPVLPRMTVPVPPSV